MRLVSRDAEKMTIKWFQYRKRYEVTCDSVSGRPQKQKAQIMVLENLLEAEHVIALFRLSLHTLQVCNDPAKPYIARLAAIRGKSENLPRFFASERFSYSSYCSMVSPFCQTKTASHFKRKGTPLNVCPESSDIDARHARCDETWDLVVDRAEPSGNIVGTQRR